MFFLRKTPHRPEVNEEREGARRLARRRSRLVLPGLVAGREKRCTGVSSPSQARGIQMWRARFLFPRRNIGIDDGERCGESGGQRRGCYGGAQRLKSGGNNGGWASPLAQQWQGDNGVLQKGVAASSSPIGRGSGMTDDLFPRP